MTMSWDEALRRISAGEDVEAVLGEKSLGPYVDGPPCQLPIEAPQRYAVTSGPALRDSALQSGRRTGTDRSVPAGLCLNFTASAAAPFVRSTSLSGWMTTFSAREPK